MAECAHVDCETRARVDGLCKKHFRALLAGEDVPRVCCVEGCDDPVRARRMCKKHYSRWSRTGDPDTVRSSKPKKTLRRRSVDILAEVDLDAIASADVDDESWRDDAACAGVGFDLFFPSGTESGNPAAYQRARAYCERCTVRSQCIAAHLLENHGCWGATVRERKAIARALVERQAVA